MKKVLKIIGIILSIIVLFLLINFIVHRIKSRKEYNELMEAGYINKYSAGDYDLNIYRIGNKDSKYKIIGISGLGAHNFSIEMSLVNEKLINDYEIIYIDRAGYGYSDSTNKKQTVQQVVSDYRTALKNAGIEGPYILMPHSLGGLYTTYWESEYPDEINGVILIDSSELGIDVWEEDDYKITFIDYLESFACKLGLQRYVLRNYVYALPKIYSSDDQKYTDYLYTYAMINKATISELKEINNNTNYVFNNIKENDIPKIYISSSNGSRNKKELQEYLSWLSNRKKEIGLKPGPTLTDEQLEKVLKQFVKWEEEHTKPYLNKLGNTDIVYLPGDHMIFEQKPYELADVIDTFIKQLD